MIASRNRAEGPLDAVAHTTSSRPDTTKVPCTCAVCRVVREELRATREALLRPSPGPMARGSVLEPAVVRVGKQ
jgi:hypothetical protein